MSESYKDAIIIGKEYELNMDVNKRKDYGSFYTPDYIIDYIVKSTIENIDVLKNPFVRIMDPSCGSGFFLIKAYDILMDKFVKALDRLKDKYLKDEYIIECNNEIKVLKGKYYWQEENLHYHLLKNCIYGADVDSTAVELTKINLLCKRKDNLLKKLNIICCDSLIKWEEDYEWRNILENKAPNYLCKYKDFEGNVKEKKLNKMEADNLVNICKFWSRKYDYIIGNPPWVSLSRKHGRNLKDKLVDYYKHKYNGNLYLPNLYEYFIKRALELLSIGGKLGFIIPDRFARNLQYKLLRENILKNYNILNLLFQIKFPGINTDTMIFIAEKDYNENNRILLGIHNNRHYFIKQKSYLQNVNFEFTYESGIYHKSIKSKIENGSFPLGAISKTFTGFIGEAKKISKSKDCNSQVKILKGENINRFTILSNYYYEFIPENIKGGTKNIYKLKCPLKILVRKTGNKLIAALDTSGYIIEQSLYGIVDLNKEYSYKYILGVINSKLIEWYYQNFLITNLNSTPQIKKYSLDKIPIKACEITRQKKIEKLVDEVIFNINLYKSEHKVDKKVSQLKENNEAYKLQNKLDELDKEIFELYSISDRERELILM